jgi:hypothetical protein
MCMYAYHTYWYVYVCILYMMGTSTTLGRVNLCSAQESAHVCMYTTHIHVCMHTTYFCVCMYTMHIGVCMYVYCTWWRHQQLFAGSTCVQLRYVLMYVCKYTTHIDACMFTTCMYTIHVDVCMYVCYKCYVYVCIPYTLVYVCMYTMHDGDINKTSQGHLVFSSGMCWCMYVCIYYTFSCMYAYYTCWCMYVVTCTGFTLTHTHTHINHWTTHSITHDRCSYACWFTHTHTHIN